jgi:hypothetical protein
MSKALVLCKMDITNDSIDLIDNTFEIAMFTAFSNRSEDGIGVIHKINVNIRNVFRKFTKEHE